jgi:hypothetical protein
VLSSPFVLRLGWVDRTLKTHPVIDANNGKVVAQITRENSSREGLRSAAATVNKRLEPVPASGVPISLARRENWLGLIALGGVPAPSQDLHGCEIALTEGRHSLSTIPDCKPSRRVTMALVEL